MSTFKDILYKKNDDETWAEWNNRLPTDDDKRDYIGETIYAKIYDENKEKAGKITGMLLVMDVEYLIPLLESNELLDEKIKEAYQILREDEEIKMSEEDTYANEKVQQGFFYHHKLEKWCEAANGGWEEYDAEVQAEYLAGESMKWWGEEEKSKVEKEEKEEEEEEEEEEKEQEEENRYDEEDHDDYKQPVVTLTVAEMIEALSKLPPDAKLVMTESGFYSTSDFAEVMLPRPYKVENGRWECDLPTGTQVYIIGHSHQSY
jgi:hypothetical protein